MPKGNEPAYPESHPDCPSPGSGLSKHELFAAMAMQGLLANPNIVKTLDGLNFGLVAKSAATMAVVQLVELEPTNA